MYLVLRSHQVFQVPMCSLEFLVPVSHQAFLVLVSGLVYLVIVVLSWRSWC